MSLEERLTALEQRYEEQKKEEEKEHPARGLKQGDLATAIRVLETLELTVPSHLRSVKRDLEVYIAQHVADLVHDTRGRLWSEVRLDGKVITSQKALKRERKRREKEEKEKRYAKLLDDVENGIVDIKL